jgi:hypothetical protein
MNTINSYIPMGPLTDETLYIERQADSELVQYVRTMEYVTIVEPRQQGKTSLVRHLVTTFSQSEWMFVYIDVSTLDASSERGWYQTLCRRISKNLTSLSFEAPLDTPQDSSGWLDFLSEITIQARHIGKKIVIILDEIGGAKFDNNILFFTTIREIYNTRQVQIDSEFKNLTFLLVGSFEPADLMQDPAISPFNIAHQVHVADFTLQQVQELMIKRGWAKEQTENLFERIHYWTGGQPYLTQLLCTYLNEKTLPDDIDRAVNKLYREDSNNLPHIICWLEANGEMKEYARKILDGEIIQFFPSLVFIQRQLFLSGWIKADENGFCSIRNHIYGQILVDLIRSSGATSSQSIIPSLD